MTLDELRQSLSSTGIEEQKELLQRFAENVTERGILEGIRIANESLMALPPGMLGLGGLRTFERVKGKA